MKSGAFVCFTRTNGSISVPTLDILMLMIDWCCVDGVSECCEWVGSQAGYKSAALIGGEGRMSW